MDVPDWCRVLPEWLSLDEHKLARLPRSARFVFAAVLDHGPATQPELAELTGLPIRTVRFAAKRLMDEKLVQTHLNMEDIRRRHFCIHTGLVAPRHLRRIGVDEGRDCVVVVQGNGTVPSSHWRKALFRASVV